MIKLEGNGSNLVFKDLIHLRKNISDKTIGALTTVQVKN